MLHRPRTDWIRSYQVRVTLFPLFIFFFRTILIICLSINLCAGKMAVLARMLQTLRLGPERIVIVSNYTQTLDLIQTMCVQCSYPVLRLDGTISANKRTSIVDQFNSPHSGAFVFLLSSKAGGCGINLIGGSRWT